MNKVSRYDIKGKKYFEIKDKFFFTDIGIKNALIGGYSKIKISGILKNIVFCSLVSSGWKVMVGQIGSKEVDFVASKQGDIMYIQVAYLLEMDKTREREFSSLLEIKDSWPKYVLSMDFEASGKVDGVEWKSVERFLFEDL